MSEVRTGTGPFTVTHPYDAVSNRTQTVRDGVTTAFTYDDNDRLLSDGVASYGWDANGNLVSRTQGASVTTYGDDGEHRLVAVTGAGGSSHHAYDADGHRVRAESAAGITRLLVAARTPTGSWGGVSSLGGTVSAHCRSGTHASTSSSRRAARSVIRPPPASLARRADHTFDV
jgi:YD repeat-containing protein